MKKVVITLLLFLVGCCQSDHDEIALSLTKRSDNVLLERARQCFNWDLNQNKYLLNKEHLTLVKLALNKSQKKYIEQLIKKIGNKSATVDDITIAFCGLSNGRQKHAFYAAIWPLAKCRLSVVVENLHQLIE